MEQTQPLLTQHLHTIPPQFICTGPYVLFNGEDGPSQRYDVSKVFAWSQDFDLSFSLQTRTSIMRVNLSSTITHPLELASLM